MNAAKVYYFEKIESNDHKEFVDAHNNCVLCGDLLELRHIRIEEEAEIKEEAYCKNCELRTRAKNYTVN